MRKCDLYLRPLNWKQGINEEGRRLSAECAIAQDAHLILSNKMRLEALLPLHILIYDNTLSGTWHLDRGCPLIEVNRPSMWRRGNSGC
jgi:hypothetical protein